MVISAYKAVISATVLAAAVSAQHHFQVTNLVSDGSVPAAQTDPNLVNAWGVAFNPDGFVWVTANGTGKATLYDGDGTPQSLVVSIPSVTGSKDPGAPTGIVFTSGMDFVVSNGSASGPARFIFVTENGTVSAWAPNVDLNHAVIVVDRSSVNAIYKGLAIAEVRSGGHRIFATDFHNNRIDVFNGDFNRVRVNGAFEDNTLPPRFAPFGIQAIGERIYVTYAKQDQNAHDELHGPGLGFVNVFDVDGHRLARVASRGQLNAPWGLVWSPNHFGRHGDQLLVGNFGDGRINAFSRDGDEHRWEHGQREPRFEFAGTLRDEHDHPIEIDGLWGIAFGNGLNNQPLDTLFFAAGPNDESSGLYGRIDSMQHH